MSQVTVGVRELKARLSYYLREVLYGKTVVITERGRPVGQIVPIAQGTEQRLQQLVETGVVAWNGRKFRPAQPVASSQGGTLVSDLLVEDRQ